MSSRKASGPSGPTIESRISRSTWSGKARAYCSATCVPYEIPIERDLVGAQRLAQRVDVEHGVGRRVEGALAARCGWRNWHGLRRVGVERAQPLQVRAAEDAGLAGAALVERGEAVAAQRRIERDRERRRRRDRRLPRAAGQGDEDLLRARGAGRRSAAGRSPASRPCGRAARRCVAQPNSSWPRQGFSAGAAPAEAGATAASVARVSAATRAERKDRPRYRHRRKVEALLDLLIWK